MSSINTCQWLLKTFDVLIPGEWRQDLANDFILQDYVNGYNAMEIYMLRSKLK